MSLLSRLFGGRATTAATPKPETYKDFTITPDPVSVEGGFRIGATIAQGDKSHHLIRADVLNTYDGAVEASLAKARQVIDQQGARLFG